MVANQTQTQNLKIFEIFSCVDAYVERELEPSGTAKKEIYEIPGLYEKIQLNYEWDKNSLDVKVVEEDIVVNATVSIDELYHVWLDEFQTRMLTVYRIPTLIQNVYIIRYDAAGEGASIVVVSTSFADAIKQAAKKLNVPLDKVFAQYFMNIVKELEE